MSHRWSGSRRCAAARRTVVPEGRVTTGTVCRWQTTSLGRQPTSCYDAFYAASISLLTPRYLYTFSNNSIHTPTCMHGRPLYSPRFFLVRTQLSGAAPPPHSPPLITSPAGRGYVRVLYDDIVTDAVFRIKRAQTEKKISNYQGLIFPQNLMYLGYKQFTHWRMFISAQCTARSRENHWIKLKQTLPRVRPALSHI